eukprot:COSAG01_NODE_716_length_14085_cov_18.724010_9_plen_177_part_00
MLTLLCAAWHAVTAPISGGGGLPPKESTTTRMIDRLQLMQICSKLSTHTISQQQFHQLWGILANSAVMAKTGQNHEHGDDTDADAPGGYSGGSGGGAREAFHAGDWLVVRETAVTEAGARGGGRVPGGAVGGVGLVGRRRWCTLVNGQLRFADQRNGATKEAIDLADVRRVVTVRY